MNPFFVSKDSNLIFIFSSIWIQLLYFNLKIFLLIMAFVFFFELFFLYFCYSPFSKRFRETMVKAEIKIQSPCFQSLHTRHPSYANHQPFAKICSFGTSFGFQFENNCLFGYKISKLTQTSDLLIKVNVYFSFYKNE